MQRFFYSKCCIWEHTVDFSCIFPFRKPFRTVNEFFSNLQTYLKFIELAISAIYTFRNGNLSEFDAHVGDASCQIRAYRIFLLFHQRYQSLKLDSTLANLTSLQEKITHLLSEGKLDSLFKKGRPLADYIKLNCLDLKISSDEAFIFQTYFLRKISVIDDENKMNGWIDFDNFRQDKPYISRNFFEKFIKMLQRGLSIDSCIFIKNLISELPDSRDLEEILPLFLKLDELDRQVLPAYISSKVIFEHLLINKFPILLICCVYEATKSKVIKRFPICLKSNQNCKDFEICNDIKKDNPYFLIKGEVYGLTDEVSIVNSIQAKGVLKLLSATMAVHRQYAGKKLYNENTIFETLKANTSILNKTVLNLCQEYFAYLEQGSDIMANSTKTFLARHAFSARITELAF